MSKENIRQHLPELLRQSAQGLAGGLALAACLTTGYSALEHFRPADPVGEVGEVTVLLGLGFGAGFGALYAARATKANLNIAKTIFRSYGSGGMRDILNMKVVDPTEHGPSRFVYAVRLGHDGLDSDAKHSVVEGEVVPEPQSPQLPPVPQQDGGASAQPEL